MIKIKLKCILLIDDDLDCNNFHERTIAELKCTENLEVVYDGEEALAFLKSGVNGIHPMPDIIFLDVNMPRMNGWEFLEEYEKLDTDIKAKVVLVMLSTSLNQDVKDKALTYPSVKGYRTKFLDKKMLTKILKDYFPGHF